MTMRKHTYYVSLILLVTLSVFWLIFKACLFYKVNYTSDIISFLQLSRDYLREKPLFFCNTWGQDCLTHNHFLLLLIAPLTNWLNAYGFFVTHVTIFAISTWLCLKLANANHRPQISLLIISIFFSPLTLWLFDNPVYGWHPELLFLPLALGFSLGLARKSNSRWAFLFLLLIIREDGAVVAFCAHAITLLFQNFADNRPPKTRDQLLKELTLISIVYLALFLIGMTFLGHFGQSRVSGALRASLSVPQVWMLKEIGNLLLLSLTLTPYLLITQNRRGLVLSLAAILPLLIVNMVAALAYGSNPQLMSYHGLTWPARVAPWLGCLAIPILLNLALHKKTTLYNHEWPSTRLSLIIITASFGLQLTALNYVRDYQLFSRVKQAFTERHPANWTHSYSQRNLKILRCLSKTLPESTTIITSNNLLSMFHKQDILEIRNLNNLRGTADLIICDEKGGRPFHFPCRPILDSILANPRWIKRSSGHLTFYFSEELQPSFRNCK
jgi:hypothetical protein